MGHALSLGPTGELDLSAVFQLKRDEHEIFSSAMNVIMKYLWGGKEREDATW